MRSGSASKSTGLDVTAIRATRRGTTAHLLIEAVLWIARTRVAWRDLPEEFGPRSSMHSARPCGVDCL